MTPKSKQQDVERTGGSDVPAGLMFVEPQAAFKTINVLLYGPGGSGKTIAATSAPGPILVLNAEGPGGLAKARALGRDIREVKFTGQSVFRPFCEYIKAGAGGAQTVVIDTVAKMYETILKELGGAKPQIQHYGMANTAIKDLVLFLRDQPINVVLVCHEKIDDSGDDRIVRPLTGGQQLPEILVGEVDVCAYCGEVQATEDRPKRWVGQLVQERGRRAKDRSGALGSFRDLDLTEWLAVYSAALTPNESDLPWSDEAAKVDELAKALDAEEEQAGSVEMALDLAEARAEA
jgi:hypothetical protein